MASQAVTEAVTKLAEQALALTTRERQQLIALLNAQEDVPANFSALQSAFRAVPTLQGLRLGAYQMLGGDLKREVSLVCKAIDEELGGIRSARERDALLHTAMKGALLFLKRSGKATTPRTLLNVLLTHSWRDLIDPMFPGYSLQLLGQTLCKPVPNPIPASPGTSYLPEPGLISAPEGRTSRLGN